ncbi:OmpA family protein [Sulfuricurvum sp.]|uniref:OmpA family protein n=1 Tax=Sulfuricurvum sp. TaxID=2025608 RepID=UPI002E2EF1A5|nr:OmpA family protein [Sulfuricurvum sp.]HEX5329218.1 OmpA family protein [Sulfuricurvum sp.]
MKYKIAFSALLAAVLLGANDHNYEISAVGGYTIPSDGQYLDDYNTYGAEMQYNGLEFAIKPELSVFYSNADYRYDSGSTEVFRTALNGVYTFDHSGSVAPFFKIGGGYESMSNTAFGNHDGFFADGGMGLKFEVTDSISMKLEAIKMFKHNDGGSDNNLLLVGGLTFAFGSNGEKERIEVSAPEPIAIPASAVVVEKSLETIKTTETTTVTEPIACPPVKTTINDHFVFNSDHIDSTAASEIRAFVIFMNENPLYKATITGHTDSIGTPENNQIVSVKRAEKVKEALVAQGIAPERLNAVGKGESMPIVSNMLKAGRAENRRIEVDLYQ